MVIFGKTLMDGYFWQGIISCTVMDAEWTLIGRWVNAEWTLSGCWEYAHGRSFLVGRSWTVIFGQGAHARSWTLSGL